MKEMPMPSNIEAEEGVLACLLFNSRNVARVIDGLEAEHFYHDAHGTIYRVIVSLYRRDKSCTAANVREELERQGKLEEIGGKVHLDDLSGSLDTLGNVEEFAEKVVFTSTMRRFIHGFVELIGDAYHQEESVIERAEQLIYSIALGTDTKSVAPLSEVMERYIALFDERRRQFKEGIAFGVPTGFRELDRLLGGLQPSRLHVIASRPSGGKTALGLNIALNIVHHAHHALFFSLEMDEGELAQRLLSMETQIDQSFLRDGDIADERVPFIKSTAKELGNLDLKIDDRTYTLSAIRSKARRIHAQKPLDLIVVDYLQLIDVAPEGRAKHETRAEEVAKISKGLKKLARELKVPVLALAQLNREIDRRANGLPQLADINESGGVERDSDVVMFIHCNETEIEKREQCLPYELTVIVRKHRNGRIGQVDLTFRPRLTKFEDQEEVTRYDLER